MLILFFDSQGIVYKEFVPQGQTVNQHFYREVLEEDFEKGSACETKHQNSWVLHHDNAPCHTATSVSQDLELEVNEDDIEELIMRHEDELTTEELQEILNEEHQET
ncbi:putative mariner transposase [Trichonephila clavipes]|nr:putative mariner transposase [Trichonephila clavipes]